MNIWKDLKEIPEIHNLNQYINTLQWQKAEQLLLFQICPKCEMLRNIQEERRTPLETNHSGIIDA